MFRNLSVDAPAVSAPAGSRDGRGEPDLDRADRLVAELKEYKIKVE
jgi:hypothetical protein